ncbi:RNA methyltransferase [Allosediminivita pacifica]|uniref:tRNA/rRNA methyltransferase n=1 Tax=Allosediminivita pacifica TaxID=1267769 RepID=A0A2T6AST9_9RHOB|nr:RNA methyltransferase [Allosediminivita pacifica]PTX46875.1 tRNA/rRNA methyltransferase [Allosediminivita pacifica]GGB15548.1 tRNA (cytidine/uridine-2'-O-)-methyltransferase TrmJ [Allosediminivita pacifica]
MYTQQAGPAFVLVRPQMGENIGAASRAMWNFGLDRMRLVSPRDGWPNPKATAMASGAGRLLDNAILSGTLPEALDDSTLTFATTARPRGMTKPVYSPEAAMRAAQEHIAQGGRVSVMFGPERAGLENADIAQANAIISVPVNPEFPSLNLAQCVLLVAYEWRRASAEAPDMVTEMGGTEWASAVERDHLSTHYEEVLDEAGFFFPETKAEGMKVNLRNMWSRMPLTQADVRMLHGMLRQMVRRRKDRAE